MAPWAERRFSCDGSSALGELARAVSERFRRRPPTAFPTKDISRLIPHDDDAHSLLHGRIVLFLSDVAGYASRATRLHREPRHKLMEAKACLSRSFFEKHPEYERYQARITPLSSPDLYRHLEEAEQDRVDVLRVLDGVLAEVPEP